MKSVTYVKESSNDYEATAKPRPSMQESRHGKPNKQAKGGRGAAVCGTRRRLTAHNKVLCALNRACLLRIITYYAGGSSAGGALCHFARVLLQSAPPAL